MRLLKNLIILTHDAAAAMAALLLATLLRFSGLPPERTLAYWWLLPLFAVLVLGFGWFFGLYRGIWRYTSTREMMRIVFTASAAILAATLIVVMATRLEAFPRSVLLMGWFITIALLSGTRILWRLGRENLFRPIDFVEGKNIVLAGLNDSTETYIRELKRRNLPDRVVAILDDDISHHGRRLHDVPIMGTLMMLPGVLDRLHKRGVTVDMLVFSRREQANHSGLMAAAQRAKLEIRRLPDVSHLADGERITNLRPVVLEDLLKRKPITLNPEPVAAMVSDKRVLISGAGGSIGSELCRQIAQLNPARMTLVDNSEFALYEIDREMRLSWPDLAIDSIIADVRDAERIDTVMKAHNPQVIFHAAALKHVPLVEDNPLEGLRTNLFGTRTMADAAARHKVETFVMISTDKAVNPTNVMGATKRAAEIYCQNHGGSTQFVTVRFGNVLGSKGSVVPLFKQQIEQGGPITVTDKRMTRYFMTIPEAVQLTMQAAAMGKGGEIFVLDMGKPVSIWEMAEQMIRLSGLEPYKDIEILEVGLRPGEKLYEELLHTRESLAPTPHESIMLAAARNMRERELDKLMGAIEKACEKHRAPDAVTALRTLVPEYIPAANSPYADRFEETA